IVPKMLPEYSKMLFAVLVWHEVVVKLCERLIAGGAPSLHFYSMNQVEPTRQLVVDLGLN
ncbi:hypothetical protein ACFMI7_22445, partial [Acinetobacter baumannii]